MPLFWKKHLPDRKNEVHVWSSNDSETEPYFHIFFQSYTSTTPFQAAGSSLEAYCVINASAPAMEPYEMDRGAMEVIFLFNAEQ